MASALFNPHSDSNLSHPVFQSRVCRLAFDPELAFHIYPWQLQFHEGGGSKGTESRKPAVRASLALARVEWDKQRLGGQCLVYASMSPLLARATLYLSFPHAAHRSLVKASTLKALVSSV